MRCGAAVITPAPRVVVPNSPAGRNSSTTRIRPNGTTSLMSSSASTYCVVSDVGDADDHAADDRADTLSNPPSAAAANANTRIACIDAGDEAGASSGSTSAPASAAERGGQAPADHQHAADGDAEQPARLGVATRPPRNASPSFVRWSSR